MYYTKIKVDNEIYDLSKTYNTQRLKKCLKLNFSQIMGTNELMTIMGTFEAIETSDFLFYRTLHKDGNLICFPFGHIDGNIFTCHVFSWNHVYMRYSKKIFRAFAIEVFKDLMEEGVDTFLIPVLKSRFKSNIYQKLLKNAFPEIEEDTERDDKSLKYLKINLKKIV